MPQYKYIAYDIKGRKCRGKKEFLNEKEFRKFLKSKRMILIQFEILKKNKKIYQGEILSFTRELKIMLESRISIIEALKILGEQYENSAFGEIIFNIKKDILNGSSIGEAFRVYKNIFGNFYVDLLYLGEISGKITENLERISINLELENKIRKKIMEALFYPCIVIVFSIVVIIFLILYVLPNFVEMFNESGTELPFITQILMSTSKNIYYIALLFICICIIIIFIKKKIKSKMRNKYDKFMMKIPVYSNVMIKNIIIRFSKNMALMMESGMLITEILELMEESFDNSLVKKDIEDMKYSIISGKGIAEALKQLEIYSDKYQKMVIIGEESGELVNMFHKISQLSQEELENYIGKILILIEPVMIIILGMIMGTVIIAIYLPIFNLSDVIK
ncbi:type II secretion system F family protein [Fusobacterium sp.]|uniref:type II secretion system F family protein n=1 Tax=Fusobacterium sp. TaxID=68766 RepID=UPI002900AE2C|nr:type II secretion system F family protein [Fusobacterium sp.]MDU1910998.1 type II secretion system F family protein [Fusobacterium sp.]